MEAGVGPPDAVCNSTNSHQVVTSMAWVTTSVAGVRDSPGVSLRVSDTTMVLLASSRAEKCESSTRAQHVLPCLWPVRCLYFSILQMRYSFVRVRAVSAISNFSKWMSLCERTNTLAGFVIPATLSHPCTPRLMPQNNWPLPTASSPLPLLSHLHSGTLYSLKKKIEKTSYWCFYG